MSLPEVLADEANFDGLVGPTHHYAGLATGNRASADNAGTLSNPREAARQGLAKMRWFAEQGLAQGLLLPHERPHLPTLRANGYSGRDADILHRVRRDDPALLAAVSSASSMWAANAATVSPSADTADGRVHFTPANLVSHRHRAIEAPITGRMLARMFADPQHFVHHAALKAAAELADEGAANHLRLSGQHGEPGVEIFVYGRDEPITERDGGEAETAEAPATARQARAAGEAIARVHRLRASRVMHLLQSPRAIDAGAFHNDVVAVSNELLLLHHEDAFVDASAFAREARAALGPELKPRFISVRNRELRLEEAVSSYLFNSQLVSLGPRGMWLICSRECAEHRRAWTLIQEWIADPANPIRGVQVFDLRQSMRNGGGPACLRLRVVLTPAQRAAVHAQSWITPERADALQALIDRYYRDRLSPPDLADPQLLDESRTVLDRMTQLLNLGSLYDFQR